MRPVIVTDVRYRTALAVIRPLGRAGYPVYAVQTAAESPRRPAAFSSRYVYKAVMLEGSVKDKDYAERLLALCTRVAKNGEKPVLFPIGADTLAMLSHDRARFRAVCDFLAAPPEVLDRANDKRAVAQAAAACGVPVPREYADPDKLPPLPVIVKPRCGEKLGQGISILIDILNPEKIVIGSIFQRSGHLLIESMNEAIKKEALSVSAQCCEVVPAMLGDEIGDFAALGVAKDFAEGEK